MSNKSLLEVDESIISNNLLLPGRKEEDDFSDLLKSINKTERPSVTIRPIPGDCVKTRTECGQKVFLNICQTTEIPPPEAISEAKLMELFENEVASNYRIPMSIGNERMESDNSGEPSSTFDIAINTNFFKQCQENKLFWAFMISVAIEGVSDKHNKRICPEEYKVLKNRKVMGKLQEHRIQKRDVARAMSKPLIEDLTRSDATSDKLETEKINVSTNTLVSKPPANEQKVSKKHEYRILREPNEGDVAKLIGEFKLNDMLSAKDLVVDVGEDRIIVEARKSDYLIDIFVPYSIDQEKVSAVLNANKNMLTLDMPVLQY